MTENYLSPRKALNKAYLKVKPARVDIESFRKNLVKLLDGLDETESEEHIKGTSKNQLLIYTSDC
ncbi:MAG: hypothetical protein Q8M08_05175 [Bacteroidales bacterium]|nr:hypothetical protein [Bacteroidales bacterium]